MSLAYDFFRFLQGPPFVKVFASFGPGRRLADKFFELCRQALCRALPRQALVLVGWLQRAHGDDWVVEDQRWAPQNRSPPNISSTPA